MSDEILSLKSVPPDADWYLHVDFSPIVPRTGGSVSDPAVAISGGHEANGAPVVGTYDARTRVWTPEAGGTWVRQRFTAGAVDGDDYRLDVTATLSQGGREARSIYAPIARLT